MSAILSIVYCTKTVLSCFLACQYVCIMSTAVCLLIALIKTIIISYFKAGMLLLDFFVNNNALNVF